MFWMNMLPLSLWLLSNPPTIDMVYTDPASVLHPVAAVSAPPPLPPAGPLFAPMPTGSVAPTPNFVGQYITVVLKDGPRCMPRDFRAKVLVSVGPQPTTITCGGDRGDRLDICAAIRTVKNSVADLDLRLTCISSRGEQVGGGFHDRRKVMVNQPTLLTLKNDGPEPCCVEVTVHDHQPMMPAPVPVQVVSSPWERNVPATCQVGMPCVLPMPQVASLPEPLPVAMPVSSTPQVALANQLPRNTHLSLVKSGEKSRVQMKSDGRCLTCGVLTLEGETGKLRIAPGKKQVHLEGTRWKAQADQIDLINLRDDGVVILKGNVRLSAERIGVGATVRAKELRVQIRQGQFEKILDQPTPIRVWSGQPTELRPVQYLQPRP
ncbi:MAG: hypothetical protein U0840_16605 [Gemmataceae bacterium]